MPGTDNPTSVLPHKEEPREIVPYRVFVGGLSHDIVVYSASKFESVAVGKYEGKDLQASGAGALNAAEAWTKAAKALSGLKDLANGRAKLPRKLAHRDRDLRRHATNHSRVI